MDDVSQSGPGGAPANALPQRDELRDGLVFPAYRQFCRDNGLNFNEYDPNLHGEATALFNRLKPHYQYYRGYVVHFHLWSCDGDFLHTTVSVEEFLAHVAQDQAQLKKFKKWVEITTVALLYVCGFICVMVFDRWLPYWLVLVIFAVIIWAGWQSFFVMLPKTKRERNKAELENQVTQLRQKLATIRLAKEIAKRGLAVVAAPKLGEALAEHVLVREADDPGDKEHRKHILADINDLLMSACPAGSEIHLSMLDDPDRLHGHLEASMDLPAQTLAKALPNRLTAWLKAEPPPSHPERPGWVQHGRFLLDQARLSGSDME